MDKKTKDKKARPKAIIKPEYVGGLSMDSYVPYTKYEPPKKKAPAQFLLHASINSTEIKDDDEDEMQDL